MEGDCLQSPPVVEDNDGYQKRVIYAAWRVRMTETTTPWLESASIG